MILNAYSGTKLQIKDEITKLFEKYVFYRLHIFHDLCFL